MFKKWKKKRMVFTHDFGGFTVTAFMNPKDASECYAQVSTTSDVYSLRVGLGNEAYNYILACADAEDWPSIEAWIYGNYTVSSFLTTSQDFAKDIFRAIDAHAARLEKLAAEAAAKVTPTDEVVADAEMRDAIAYGNMDDKEREVRKEEMRKEFKVLLGEMGEVDSAEPSAGDSAEPSVTGGAEPSAAKPAKPKSVTKAKSTTPKSTAKKPGKNMHKNS